MVKKEQGEKEIKLTASIVAYNSADEILNVLNSLSKINVNNFAVTIVDNASSDNTVALVKKNYPTIKVIESKKNVGFGAGHNLAIKEIDSDYHIFVNPDISVESNQIKNMIEYLEKNKDVVILTPKVLNTDGTEQFLPKVFPKIKYVISGKLESKANIFYKWRSQYTFRDRVITEPIEIQYSTGCFMVCRTSALKAVGGFDERYFLHFEDADLTREMLSKGRVMYNPNVYVTHTWHRDNIKNKNIRKIALQSLRKYYMKWGYFSK